ASVIAVCFAALGSCLPCGSGGVAAADAFAPPPTSARRRPPAPPAASTASASASGYLESLGADGAGASEGEDDALRSLRNKRGRIRSAAMRNAREAARRAARRTNFRGVLAERYERAGRERRERERRRLEELRAERTGGRDEEEREAAREEGGRAEDGEPSSAGTVERRAERKRGVPVLDVLDRPPMVRDPPLLVGGSRTFGHSDLTPFQRRALDVAASCHEEHRARTKAEEGDGSSGFGGAGGEGGIEAAPIVAVVDGYTPSAASASADAPSSEADARKGRYATLASVEVLAGSDGRPSKVKLTGVGRAFLRGYFGSKDAGLTREEEELSALVGRIRELEDDGDEEEDDEDETCLLSDDGDVDEDCELDALMAEFDVFLDDSSLLSSADESKYGRDVVQRRASSMHAVTELYRAANKVYRLHEERKNIVAGLRAGEARLALGRQIRDENCPLEFEDCDGLGLIGRPLDDDLEDVPLRALVPSSAAREDVPAFRGHRLEGMENYGLGTYGVLSSMPELARQAMSRLEPYYSPEHREREEYEAEVASMVAFRTLEEYASPEEVASALVVPSATRRLELAYDIMMRHRDELVDLVKIVSQELIDCGEECTDLW
ncbi:hypothetical protein ACHAWF_017104, partial [Thalassiosira exigua]